MNSRAEGRSLATAIRRGKARGAISPGGRSSDQFTSPARRTSSGGARSGTRRKPTTAWSPGRRCPQSPLALSRVGDDRLRASSPISQDLHRRPSSGGTETRPVPEIDPRLRIEQSLLDQTRTVAWKAPSPPRRQSEDLTDLPILENAVEHQGHAGRPGQMADHPPASNTMTAWVVRPKRTTRGLPALRALQGGPIETVIPIEDPGRTARHVRPRPSACRARAA
jgi:hypothetical protein